MRKLINQFGLTIICATTIFTTNKLTAQKIATQTPGDLQKEVAQKIVLAARAQIGQTLHYDGSYTALDYPNGDVPIELGVCTDVIIRALRSALGYDLQKLVHEDMKKNFTAYPKNWGLKRPDKNIDHRRVPNLRKFFQRRGYSLPTSKKTTDYLPGDLVTCTVPPHLPHIMIVSDKKTLLGDRPLVIHNIGSGAREQDMLFRFPHTGHYRLKNIPPAAPPQQN